MSGPLEPYPPLRADFAHVTHWVFDLDNTLYPARSNLFAQIDQRMTDYVSRLLNLSFGDARQLQKAYYRSHGTTLNGLMALHGADPHEYLAYVHAIDVSVLEPDPVLCEAIGRLPGRKEIFTNGSAAHAERVTAQLGLNHLFDAVVDIQATGYQPKPWTAAYHALIDHAQGHPSGMAFFEDLPRNLEPAHALGMTTVLVQSDHPWRRDGPVEDASAQHIHHETSDLSAFLSALTEARHP